MEDEWSHQVLRSGNRFDIPPRYWLFIPTALSPRQLDVQLCGPLILTIWQSYPDRRGTSNCESYRLHSTLYKSCYILHSIVTSSPTSFLLLTAFGEPNSTGLSITEYSSHTCSSDGCLNLENKYEMWWYLKKINSHHRINGHDGSQRVLKNCLGREHINKHIWQYIISAAVFCISFNTTIWKEIFFN